MHDFLQIEDTEEFANYESAREERAARVLPDLDDNLDSKVPALSDAQWAHMCAFLDIDTSVFH